MHVVDWGGVGEVRAPNFESVQCREELDKYAEVCEAMRRLGILEEVGEKLVGRWSGGGTLAVGYTCCVWVGFHVTL